MPLLWSTIWEERTGFTISKSVRILLPDVITNSNRDLYYLVKFLPGYAFPHGLPSNSEPLQDSARSTSSAHPSPTGNSSSVAEKSSLTEQNSAFMNHNYPPAEAGLPSPVTANQKKTKFVDPVSILSQRQSQSSRLASSESQRLVLPKKDEVFLLPAKMPPKYHIFDLFPFSLLVKALTNRGKELKGKKAAKLRAKMKSRIISHNLPLEISLYLVRPLITHLRVNTNQDKCRVLTLRHCRTVKGVMYQRPVRLPPCWRRLHWYHMGRSRFPPWGA